MEEFAWENEEFLKKYIELENLYASHTSHTIHKGITNGLPTKNYRNVNTWMFLTSIKRPFEAVGTRAVYFREGKVRIVKLV